jgi:hypothetical protein
VIALAQTLGAVAPWMPLAGAIAAVGVISWLLISAARRGHAATASSAGFGDQVETLLSEALDQVDSPAGMALRARLDQLRQTTGAEQIQRGIRAAVQAARGR